MICSFDNPVAWVDQENTRRWMFLRMYNKRLTTEHMYKSVGRMKAEICSKRRPSIRPSLCPPIIPDVERAIYSG